MDRLTYAGVGLNVAWRGYEPFWNLVRTLA
jgi:hypothetical protein